MRPSAEQSKVDDSPEPRRSKATLLAVILAISVISLIAWVYAQPFLVLGHVRAAALKRDPDALAEVVDFPALRGNLKASMNVYMTKSMASTTQDNPFGALGILIGDAMVDRLVDAYVTPNGIAMLTSGARPDPSNATSESTLAVSRPAKIHQGYRSASVFHVVVQSDTSATGAITFVLHRRGFSWLLTDIRTPLFEDTDATPSSR